MSSCRSAHETPNDHRSPHRHHQRLRTFERPFMTRIQLLTSLALASLLAACGGNDDTNPPRGALIEAPTTVATMTTAQIDAATAQSGLQALSGTAKCA